MTWMRSVSLWLAPGMLLAAGVVVILFDGFGLQSALSKQLFGAYQGHVASALSAAVEQLAGTAVIRPGWAHIAEAVLLVVLGTATIAFLRFGLGWSAVMAMAGAILLGLGSWYFYARRNLLLDAATPALFLGLAFAAGMAAWLYRVHLARVGLRMAFADRLPPAVLEAIARRPQLLKPDGEWRTVTYMACGIESAASDDAAAFTSRTQSILARLVDQVVAHGGTIERAGADGFAAFWNAPLDDVEHEMHACEAANAMAAMIAEAAQYDPPILISAGIASGPVIAGGFGGQGHLAYGVQGETKALAHKIRALARNYHAPLIVSEQTRRLAERNFALLEVDTIPSPGDNTPIMLHALMGGVIVRASPKFRALSVFHDHIFQAIRSQNWRVARDLIAQGRRLSGANQALYDLHLTRIAYYERNPPGDAWDGAFRTVLE